MSETGLVEGYMSNKLIEICELGHFLSQKVQKLQVFTPIGILKNFNPIMDALIKLKRDTENIRNGHGTSLIVDTAVSNDHEFQEILNKILESVLYARDYENGTFCKTTCPKWVHIQTAYVLHALKNLDLIPANWIDMEGRTRSMKNMLEGLIAAGEDGHWKEDFYDTCYTLSALLRYKKDYDFLANYDTVIKKSLAWIIKTIQDDFEAEKAKEWYGAGFMGAGLYLFGYHFSDIKNCGYTWDALKQTLNTLAKKLTTYDRNNFYSSDATSNLNTPEEWHTAEAIIGLKYYNNIQNNFYIVYFMATFPGTFF